ncbi:uncharacterized protein EV154DRAFT_499089 [Mucor mucedo]|uniref:uncharacterized protein n=1 Tax=Mucor mucedo TaxID=29922 RepID=UPI00221EAC9F|nr:uncharacterized protein EV154DRAFT_499089 [Mucor mucedo]KAI7894281.1 hypothetical protein EV154DRAFT_499089 [Mucor mucedo]
MQASTTKLNVESNTHDMFIEQPELDNAPTPSTELGPNESYYPYIPYVLDPQHEDNISIDMIKLYQELLPNKESHDRRIKFVKLMDKLMNNEWPDHDIKAHVFGSSVNELGTVSSDIDLCITTPWNGLRNVKTLAKLFRKCGMQHVVCVPRAKVPIVRLFDPELQLSCDINVNNTLALQNTKMIKTYVALDCRVRPLIMIVKHWTKQRSINDAANGGTLSSYTWTCMIINFLQQRQPPILPVLHDIESEDKDDAYFFDNVEKLKGFSSANQESLGGLLFAFFRRFSVEFDYDHQVVSVRQGRYLSKVEKGWDTGRNKQSLCVEEPFNVGRNLGNSADIASVQGLRCEFQRFLEMLIAGEDLETICTPYQPLSISSIISNNEIPANINGNSNTLTLTLPAENRTSSFFLPIHPYSDYSSSSSSSSNTAHPYDRRRSMVDGICSYPSPILLDDLNNSPYPTHSTSYTYRAPPISKPHTSSFNTFHPRFSSPQALDTILRVRNTRHGSHPLPPVPSTLLSMLNISANHGTDQSVDKIFARYHRKQQSNQTTSPPQKSTDGKSAKKTSTMGPNNRRKPVNNNRHNHHHHHDNSRRLPRRRSSGMDWPTISTSSSTPTAREKGKLTESSSDEPQRSRRWSTTKKQQMLNQEEPKKTLAEIVKIATPPIQQKSSPISSPVPSPSSTSNNKNNRHRRQRNNNKSLSTTTTTTASNSKPKKKNNSSNSKPPRA